jgi:hypothetical protein
MQEVVMDPCTYNTTCFYPLPYTIKSLAAVNIETGPKF